MTYLFEIKETPESKTLIAKLRALKYVKHRKIVTKEEGSYHYTDEEMALPLRKKPTEKEFNEFLDRKQGKGHSLEEVRNRLLNNIAPTKK
jgi:hypothetical protein